MDPLLTNTGTKKFRLSIRTRWNTGRVQLPPVVFGAESLHDLRVEKFSLDQMAIQSIVFLKNLKSLRLEKVCIEDENFDKIISNCIFIETLVVKDCKRLRTIKVNDLRNLKYFCFKVCQIILAHGLCPIEVHPPSLEIIDIRDGNLRFYKGADFRNLEDLSLCNVKSSLEHLSSCKFPSLKYLNISGWPDLKESQIFIDAPNIRNFDFIENFVPSISFAATSGEWDSVIYINFELSQVTCSWFLKLKELLESLSQSGISLTLYQTDNQYPMDNGEHIIQEIINLVHDNGCDKPALIKSLTFRCHSSLISSFLNGVFCICRPRNIQDCLSSHKEDTERVECLWKILMQREIGKEDKFSELWFQDLEEVRMEINDKNEKKWHTIQLPNDEQRGYHFIRFAFKWRQTL